MMQVCVKWLKKVGSNPTFSQMIMHHTKEEATLQVQVMVDGPGLLPQKKLTQGQSQRRCPSCLVWPCCQVSMSQFF